MTVRTKQHPNVSSPTGLAHLANDLRLACMRISRRVRFESTDTIAPHQFSVLARLDGTPRTPRELADIEKVSAPSMTRTVAGLVELGLVARQRRPDRRPAGDPHAHARRRGPAEGHPPPPRPVDGRPACAA